QPVSTLLPYTTLFRSEVEPDPAHGGVGAVPLFQPPRLDDRRGAQASRAPHPEQKRLPAGFTNPQACAAGPEAGAGAAPPPCTASTASMAASASRSRRARSAR